MFRLTIRREKRIIKVEARQSLLEAPCNSHTGTQGFGINNRGSTRQEAENRYCGYAYNSEDSCAAIVACKFADVGRPTITMYLSAQVKAKNKNPLL